MPSVELSVVIEEQVIAVTAEPTPSVNVSLFSQPFTVVIVPGPPGIQGAPGDNTQIVGETPSDLQDGVNTVFTSAHPYVAGSTAVYRNGLREYLGEGYFETGSSTITFSDPPLADDVIRMDYIVTATVSEKLSESEDLDDDGWIDEDRRSADRRHGVHEDFRSADYGRRR